MNIKTQLMGWMRDGKTLNEEGPPVALIGVFRV